MQHVGGGKGGFKAMVDELYKNLVNKHVKEKARERQLKGFYL